MHSDKLLCFAVAQAWLVAFVWTGDALGLAVFMMLITALMAVGQLIIEHKSK